MNQYIALVIAIISSSFFTRLFFKRKTLAEDRAAELDNAVTAVKYYRDLLDDMATRLTSAIETIKKMEIEHRELMKINQELVDELQKFKQLNGKAQ